MIGSRILRALQNAAQDNRVLRSPVSFSVYVPQNVFVGLCVRCPINTKRVLIQHGGRKVDRRTLGRKGPSKLIAKHSEGNTTTGK